MRSIITLGFSIVPARAQADVETGCADLARRMHDLAMIAPLRDAAVDGQAVSDPAFVFSTSGCTRISISSGWLSSGIFRPFWMNRDGSSPASPLVV